MPSDWQKTRVFLRGYFIAGGKKQSLKMLEDIEEWHGGQKRNDGVEYIAHPIRVASYLIALGFDDDEVIAAALGHDVIEDTMMDFDGLMNRGYTETVARLIEWLTTPEKLDKEKHLINMLRDAPFEVLLIKIADRINNVSDMAGVFKHDRLVRYLEETRAYIYPMVRRARKMSPEHRPTAVLMKYHLESVVDSITAMLPIDLKE